MVAKTVAAKLSTQCAACGEEFKGKKCPECGNITGNLELSGSGIPKSMAYESTAFGSAMGLRPVGNSIDSEFEMSQQIARSQEEELSNNLREAFVLKSEIKRLALEDALNKKKNEINPPPRYTEPEPQQQVPNMNFDKMFQPNTISPQAQFMNKFMNMDVEERGEFLEQLTNADPSALSTLSSFFAQNNPQLVQASQMNPYAQMQMNPYMQYPPPWMQQQQHEPQYVQEDPTQVALAIVEKLQDLSSRNQNTGPSESASIVATLREELSSINEQIASIKAETSRAESETVNRRMAEMENYLYSAKPDNSLKEQISGIKEMVSDLREIGFIDAPESKQTVDEQIRLSQAKHDITKEDREMELKERELTVQSKTKDMQKALVSSLFTRQLHKSLGNSEGTEEKERGKHSSSAVPTPKSNPYSLKKPDVIVDEFITDSGIVRETSVPISKKQEE